MKLKYGYYLLGLTALFGSMYYVIGEVRRRRRVAIENEENNTEIISSNNNNTIYPSISDQTDHFKMSEFSSNDGVAVPIQYQGNVYKLMQQLEIIRTALNNTPIRINSGYRSPSHNAAVGGVSNSQHLVGKAADITTAKHTPKQIKDIIENLIAQGKIIEGGVGIYPTFVHYDIRGTKARWSGTGTGF
jgi:uncharacterized protein YcbK (DUF882 family)